MRWGATASALAYTVLLGYLTVRACLSLHNADFSVWFVPAMVVLTNVAVAFCFGPQRDLPILTTVEVLLLDCGIGTAGAMMFSQHHGPVPYDITGAVIWAAVTLVGTAVSIQAVRMWCGQFEYRLQPPQQAGTNASPSSPS